MVIGIDGNEANIENRVGVNQYGFELLWGIYRLREEWGKKHKVIVYLKNSPLVDMPPESGYFRYKILSGGGLWIIKNLMSNLILDKDRPDVFFSPSHYVPPLSPVQRVCSIMDLGYLEFSGQFRKYDFWQLKLWSAWSIFVSKYVIAISNSTKEDIVRHYPFASKKVIVTPLAHDKKRFNTDISSDDVRRIKKKYSIVGDYVLFLSTLKPSKNVEGLLEAWKIIHKKWPEIRLVIAGKKGWLYGPIFEKAEKLNLQKKVAFIDFVPEHDKPALIFGAKIFILPSFWEGFGLDVLNAMACGTPVVVSNKGSLPEVVGNAGILINPDKPRDIAEGLDKVLSMNEIEYNRLVEKGLSQAKKFSWIYTAKQTIRILEKVVE